jgi:hypothetical protein
MIKTEGDVISEMSGAVPRIGWTFSLGFDLGRGEYLGAAQGGAEEGLEQSVQSLVERGLGAKLPIGLTPLSATNDIYKMDKAFKAHNENVRKKEAVDKEIYRLKRKLGHPDARYYLPGGRGKYRGPDGILPPGRNCGFADSGDGIW